MGLFTPRQSFWLHKGKTNHKTTNTILTNSPLHLSPKISSTYKSTSITSTHRFQKVVLSANTSAIWQHAAQVTAIISLPFQKTNTRAAHTHTHLSYNHKDQERAETSVCKGVLNHSCTTAKFASSHKLTWTGCYIKLTMDFESWLHMIWCWAGWINTTAVPKQYGR